MRPPLRLLELAGLASVLAASIGVIHHTRSTQLVGDEWRYVYYADNLLHGFYSPRDRVFLWNGPGYPLAIAPFVWVGGVDAARYANAAWLGGALAYVWGLLRRSMSPGRAFAGVIVLGAYVPVLHYLPLAYSEVFAYFLSAAWVYHSLQMGARPIQTWLGGLYLGLLALTKVVFGPALVVFTILLWLLHRFVRPEIRRAFLRQTAIALLVCAPWLFYTYRLTGRPFYWASAGANSFYWLTSPYDGEWGDWYHQGWVRDDPMLHAHHGALFDRLSGLSADPSISDEQQMFNLSTPEAADVFAAAALHNVRRYPLTFARNWAANVVRLFLDVPVSVRETRALNTYSVAHVLLLAWTAFVVIAASRAGVPFPREWVPIALFAAVGLASSTLVSAAARFLIPFVPIWWAGSCCWYAQGRRNFR